MRHYAAIAFLIATLCTAMFSHFFGLSAGYVTSIVMVLALIAIILDVSKRKKTAQSHV